MRFVIAIVTFVVAAALIGLGIAQRTVWAPAPNFVASATVSDGTAYTVINGKVLGSHPGQQTLTVSGGKKQFVAYGRTADVMAWIGNQRYTKITYQPATGELHAAAVTPKRHDDTTSTATPAPQSTDAPAASSSGATKPSGGPAAAPNPVGSDLWLAQFVGADAARTKMNVPANVSVIIASDGVAPAPDKIAITWPKDTRTPLAGPLIAAGCVLLLAGLVMYLLAIRAMRRGRGPRRGGPKPPKLPRKERYKPKEVLSEGSEHRALGRGMVAVPVVLVGSLLMTGCSAQYWPDLGAPGTAAPTATATPLATSVPGQSKDAPPPVVTAGQLTDIVHRIAATAAQADSKLDTALVKTRFTGAALAERETNYAIRAKKSDAPAPQAIPNGPVKVALPQATATWPRTVGAVVADSANPKVAPLGLVLVQENPHVNYQVAFSVTLQPDAKVPPLPPATIGTASVPPDSKLLAMEPQKVAAAYGDILMNGDKSPYWNQFDEAHDGLAKQVGAAYKANQIAQYPKTGSLAFAEQATGDDPIALATNDSGALVATSLNETATVKPVESGAKVGQGATTAALTGVTESATGLQTTYGYQLLFYVPPAGSKDKITLLGFTQAVVGAKEL